MHLYNLSNDFTNSNIDDNKNIKNDTYDNTTEHVCYEDLHKSNNYEFSHSVGVVPKDDHAYPLSFCTHDTSYQDNNHEEDLLPPDIFKLTQLGELNLSSKIYSFDTNQPSTSSALKRQYIEEESILIKPNPKRIDLKKISINKNEVKKNIRLTSYRINNLWHTKSNSRIVYIDAIKKIGIDNDGLFKRSVLKKMGKIIEERNLLKSHIDLSQTYSNIRKYVLYKISSLFEDDTIDTGILITPGMSISDLRSSFISNSIFLKKLREHCGKIKKDIRVTPNNNLSRIFQSNIILNNSGYLNSTEPKIRFQPKKDRFIPDLKELIIDTVSNLPNSIIYEIEKIDPKNIVNSLFSGVHGVLVSKSLIKNIKLLFTSNRHEFEFANKRSYDNLNSFNKLLGKIANIVRKFCIFHDGFFLPDESTVEQLSKYLLSDMYGVSSKFHKKLNLLNQNIQKPQGSIDNVNLKSNYTKDMTTPITRDTDQSKQETMTKEFGLKKPYRKTNLLSAGNTSNIYECAIKKISIDNNFRFKDNVLEELGAYITTRGLTKSSINLSTTYSNVRKYVLDKISPYISDAITTTDVLITPGISLSDLAYNFASNSIFFEKLSKSCEEAVKNIKLVPSNYFSGIIQSHIYFNSPERLISTRKKNKLCSAIKLLITETISNLPNNIIHEIKKFNHNEITDGLFVNIHNVHLQKSLIRKLELIFNSNKLSDNKFISNLNLLNNLLTKIFIEVESHPVLHEGKIFFPGEHTAKLLSKYLLSDMYSIPTKIHKKLTLNKHIKDNMSESNYEKSSETNVCYNMKISSLNNPLLIPQQKKLKWDHDPISPISIYKLALSRIDIDKSDFECSFIDKSKHYRSIAKYLSRKEKIDIDLSITYTNVKNYILKKFSPFLKEIEEETRTKIKLTNGMTIDELVLSYASNQEFLDKLREFCNKVIIGIKDGSNNALIDLIQLRIPLGIEISKKIMMNKERKNSFLNEMEKLLITNISNVPKTIAESIKLVPHADIINGYFSNFYDMYVDNKSLLKAKIIFDTITLKVINDPLLSESLDKIDKTMKRNRIMIKKRRIRIINSNLICGELPMHRYLNKLVEKEFPILKDKLSDHIFIIRNNKIETADQKIRDEIFDKLESDLIETAVISYNRLFVKKYKSKVRTKKS
ncbi:hypothetical protein Ark11_1059 [Candidatus Ichthyocystis hellenicum]|uniref:Uncharacterized protein n=1 Tax=Candidatus Ichthyocystis hellenicum TaxID=1561003 RepID=A0A0S4M277_9BURK|nr:hypothetical protein [Candidatus Ichthyocystis hellenicum]CUT17875.1 hypothetical protein Ark11_1059 [Candidatus Ichthyocystis hellenicum]